MAGFGVWGCAVLNPLKTLWTLWRNRSVAERRRPQAKTPIARNLARRAAPQLVRPGTPSSSSSAVTSAAFSSRAASSWSFCAPPSRLGDDPVDHAELEAVPRVGLERRGGLLRLAAVAPEDRRAALGRDHRVDRVLLHQHAVGDGERDRAARAALADHAGDRRHARAATIRACERAIAPPWPCCSAATPGIGAGRVDQRDDREAEALRERPSRASPWRSPRGTPSRTGALIRSLRSRPFWWPTSATVRPSSVPIPVTIAPSSARPRSPCSSTQSSRIRST